MDEFKPPKTIGACIDQLYRLRAQRLKLQHEIDVIGSQETKMREHIIRVFTKDEINGAKGSMAACAISTKLVPSVKDWNSFYGFMLKTRSLDLLQRRVHEKAWRDRVEAGESIPGVEAFHIISLSLTKL